MKAVILAHNFFTKQGGKTARGIYLYADFEITAILDKSLRVNNAVSLFPQGRSVPIYSSIEQINQDYDTLIIGVSPIGGKLSSDWRREIKYALEHRINLINGLHAFLSEDEEFKALCPSCITDLRKPDPALFRVLDGSGNDASTLMITGTDCSCGKMVTSIELNLALKREGINSGFIATGQTGMLCGADEGAVIDRIPGDFMAGVVEGMVNKAKASRDVLIVEGQGSLHHPAYSGVTLSIIHGCNAKGFIMCHNPSRTQHHDFPGSRIPPLADIVKMTEDLAGPVSGGKIAGFSIIGENMPDRELMDYIKRTEDIFSLPATDVWRFGCKNLAEHLIKHFKCKV